MPKSALPVAELARRIRVHCVKMTGTANASHIGSALSMADLLAVLYGRFLNFDPARPDWPERDRFILSKGHACTGSYGVLAESGYFPLSALETFYQNGSPLAGHATHKGVPGVEISTGSLGHGLPMATGMALAAQARSSQPPHLLPVERRRMRRGLDLGGGALRAAPQARQPCGHGRLQQDSEPRAGQGRHRPRAARGQVAGVRLGCSRDRRPRSRTQIERAFAELPFEPGKPSCIVAHTVKGKGVSFMEDQLVWHYRAPRGELMTQALSELEPAE